MTSVLVLLGSGLLNAVARIAHLSQLWQTRYGVLLSVKVALVGVALGAAMVSRSRLRASRSLYGSVSVEAAVTVVVLAVTSVLTLTGPPATVAAQPIGQGGAPGGVDDTATVRIGDGGQALVRFAPPDTTGSEIRVTLLDAARRPLPSPRVTLQVSLPSQQINSIAVPLTVRRPGVWTGRYRFPLAGRWKVTVSVEDANQLATLSSGSILISG
jgi:copper transport protein